MTDNLTVDFQASQLIVRCECGTIIVASEEVRLVELTRLHFGEFHPDLGSNVPADLILSMAEEKESKCPKKGE
jgi:hypothetical protein